MRLDKYLFQEHYYESREKASIAIKKGLVLIDNKVITKPAFEYESGTIFIKEELLKYVSFGGNKLERAIEVFKLDFKDKVLLDIGASTGGFTDCALQAGAKLVYAVDVGSNQLHEKLRQDKRVLSYENTNILNFYVDQDFDYLVCDVSFVSITKIIPYLKRFLNDDNSLICLIKPQFEVGNKNIKNGVVKDIKVHEEVLNNTLKFINEMGLYVYNLTYSTQVGKKGNIEYLTQIGTNNAKEKKVNVKEVVNNSHKMES